VTGAAPSGVWGAPMPPSTATARAVRRARLKVVALLAFRDAAARRHARRWALSPAPPRRHAGTNGGGDVGSPPPSPPHPGAGAGAYRHRRSPGGSPASASPQTLALCAAERRARRQAEARTRCYLERTDSFVQELGAVRRQLYLAQREAQLSSMLRVRRSSTALPRPPPAAAGCSREAGADWLCQLSLPRGVPQEAHSSYRRYDPATAAAVDGRGGGGGGGVGAAARSTPACSSGPTAGAGGCGDPIDGAAEEEEESRSPAGMAGVTPQTRARLLAHEQQQLLGTPRAQDPDHHHRHDHRPDDGVSTGPEGHGGAQPRSGVGGGVWARPASSPRQRSPPLMSTGERAVWARSLQVARALNAEVRGWLSDGQSSTVKKALGGAFRAGLNLLHHRLLRRCR
jgi:hypothetical protein